MKKTPLLLARQPIATRAGEIFGYELLHRDSASGDTSATAKSAQVLCEALSNQSAQEVVGNARMFVNFGEDLLATEVPLLLPAGQGVVEVVEDVEPSVNIFRTLDKARARGLGIALDDFMFQPNMIPFLPHANYVKIDIQQAANDLDEIVMRLKRHPVALIAEKVETPEQAQRCQALGFELFQGFFFARPETLQSKAIGSTHVAIVSLIADLQNPDLEPEALAQSISQDLGIAHRILKLCNSVAYRRQRPISSIADAVVLLGRDLLTQWGCLLLMTRLTTQKPPELFSMALVRARLCQVFGSNDRRYAANELYTVGLLSLLDALLDRDMPLLAKELSLAPVLRDALCGEPGSGLGAILRRAIAYEAGDWSSIGPLSREQEGRLSQAYASAVQFARQTLGR